MEIHVYFNDEILYNLHNIKVVDNAGKIFKIEKNSIENNYSNNIDNGLNVYRAYDTYHENILWHASEYVQNSGNLDSDTSLPNKFNVSKQELVHVICDSGFDFSELDECLYRYPDSIQNIYHEDCREYIEVYNYI